MSAWSTDKFWQFSLAIYADANVQTRCLQLQDEFALNVNLLLLCAFLDRHAYCLSQPQMQQLRRQLAPLDAQTKALRQQRRAAKTEAPTRYARLLEQELQLERQQQNCLISALNLMLLEKRSGNNFLTYVDCVTANSSDLRNPVTSLRTAMQQSLDQQ